MLDGSGKRAHSFLAVLRSRQVVGRERQHLPWPKHITSSRTPCAPAGNLQNGLV